MAIKRVIARVTVLSTVVALELAVCATALPREPRPKDSIRSPLAYPNRVTPPPELVSVEEATDKDDNPQLMFPVVDYLLGHYDGWQSFLDRFGHQGRGLDEAVELPIMQSSGKYQQHGFKDGYRDAQRDAQRFAKERGVAVARQVARDAYLPRRIPAPVPKDRAMPSLPQQR